MTTQAQHGTCFYQRAMCLCLESEKREGYGESTDLKQIATLLLVSIRHQGVTLPPCPRA